jgi:peptidyl-prolyl cis-trans isomerase C
MTYKKLILFLLVFLLTACGTNPTITPSPAATVPTGKPVVPTALPVTPTVLLPSPTSEPLAVRVNGEGISLTRFNSEMQRLQAGLKETGKELSASEQQTKVLEESVNQVLLAQAAVKDGFKLDDTAFQKRVDGLVEQAGGSQAFSDWLKKNFYTDADFRKELWTSIAAAWQRDRIFESAPKTADQIHARQILLLESATADRFYNLLKAGADFATLAYQADPDLGGDLGWFPKGYLVLPEIEQAAFGLAPGKFSEIIKTAYGYQIIQVIERDPQHPLSTDARRMFQDQQMRAWLADQRSKSSIETLVPNP